MSNNKNIDGVNVYFRACLDNFDQVFIQPISYAPT